MDEKKTPPSQKIVTLKKGGVDLGNYTKGLGKISWIKSSEW